MPQGDLFPVFVNTQKTTTASFTDVKVSYNNPTDIHPFSNVYRPPSGSYAGSTTWNNWYDGLITSTTIKTFIKWDIRILIQYLIIYYQS